MTDPQNETAVPWARQQSVAPPVTTRVRKIAEHLPGWEPLPPGEVLVQRHRKE